MTCLHLPPVPASVGTARKWAANLLPDDIRDDVGDEVVLVLSELLTNAVTHAATAPPSGTGAAGSVEDIEVEVVVDPGGGHVALAVTDPSDQPLPAAPETVEPEADHGRGLLLLDALAQDHGWAPRVGGGKCVWALFRRPRVPSRDGRGGVRGPAVVRAGCAGG
ncbi:ATP-binding protein [Streptomyces sp. OUCMDZ-4982]|uniref:ATP-binding protein n=1 Tax=Streptomyces sp. OUCMDZ-4982 TaxID=2973090 RepID=UPI00215C58B6|nr:ATP-binding protein [Streptomyces sp. OUCMDZ-4982]MCR8945068.1 ATP-binding protein [Streptomyces sp. OUCMDZ-4982]